MRRSSTNIGKNKGGRPRKRIDPRQVYRLAKIDCSLIEIGFVVGCSPDTLRRGFAAEIDKGKADGKTALRRVQNRIALKGNVAMLIWLGKQRLEQRDKTEIRHEELDGLIERELARLAGRGEGTDVVPAAADSRSDSTVH